MVGGYNPAPQGTGSALSRSAASRPRWVIITGSLGMRILLKTLAGASLSSVKALDSAALPFSTSRVLNVLLNLPESKRIAEDDSSRRVAGRVSEGAGEGLIETLIGYPGGRDDEIKGREAETGWRQCAPMSLTGSLARFDRSLDSVVC